MSTLQLDAKQQDNIFRTMAVEFPKWMEQIDRSFLSADIKAAYTTLLTERMKRLN